MPRQRQNPNETHADRFKRLAEARTKEVIRRIRILGNCANRFNYTYSSEQVVKIFTVLENELRRTKEKFEEHSAPPDFKL